MLVRLAATNWPIHGDFSLKFDQGLISIHGHSETGKTLILEAVNFALWGSQALRLPANKYGKIGVMLEFKLAGQQYTLARSLTNASMTKEGDEAYSVQGTTAVNEEIQKLFGFGFKVFLSSVYSRQGEVRYLSTLKSAERKKVINNMLGLEAVELSLKQYKEELKYSKQSLAGLEARLTPVQKPEFEYVEGSLEELRQTIPSLDKQIQEWVGYYARKEALEKARVDEPVGVLEPQRTSAELHDLMHQHTRLINDVKNLENSLLKVKRDYSGIVSSLHSLPDVSLDEVLQQERAYEDYVTKINLQNKGSITCESCGHINFLAAESLAKYAEVGEVAKPQYSSKVIRANQEQFNRKTMLEKEIGDFENKLTQAQEALKVFQSANPSMDALQYELDQINKYQAYLVRKSNYETWTSQFLALQAPKGQPLEELQVVREAAQTELFRLQDLRSQWVTYQALVQQQQKLEIQIQQDRESVNELARIVKGFTEMHQQIKGHLLPSINQLASALLFKLSSGMHYSVCLTESIDIVIDEKHDVEVLSGSGKALAYLAIRIALGSVLTTKVFPVMIFDEVDEGMCPLRSANVMAALHSIAGKCGQVFVISHKDIENADQFIPVPLEN